MFLTLHGTSPALRRERRRARPFREVLRAVGLGVSLGLLAVVAGLALVLVVLPKATGSIPLTVLTGSMEPSLPPGTLLVVRPVDPDDVHVGDVVTYQIASGEPAVISHRVTAITAGSDGTRTFTFQGDANAQPDPAPVVEDQIKGRLWYSLPMVGWVNQAVNGPASAWLLPLGAGALLAYAAWMIVSGVLERRRVRRNTHHRRRAHV